MDGMNRMLKLIFMVILTVALGRVTAQEVEIKKSADVIVLQGKSFYLHTVLPGQTLFLRISLKSRAKSCVH